MFTPTASATSGSSPCQPVSPTAAMAATRLPTDSSASERRPTEPVRRKAPALSEMVVLAAAIDSQAKRVSEREAAGESDSDSARESDGELIRVSEYQGFPRAMS